MTEEELTLKETELQNRENELATREAELKQREEQDNTAQLVTELKQGYEEKLLKQYNDLDKRIKERDNVIKQLLTGDKPVEEKDIIQIRIDAINEKRERQNKKW